MRKNVITMATAALAVVGLGVFMSACSSDKKSQNETIAEEQFIEEQEVMPLSTPNYDSLRNENFKTYFDANNIKKSTDDIVTTPSGLKYIVVREGAGKSPAATDNVTVNYAGRLTDGTQFDSSYDRGEPTTFPLNRVIPGWTEGLQTMKEGGKTIFYIPSNLAYGEQGAPGAVPPNSDLIFEVELISVNQ